MSAPAVPLPAARAMRGKAKQGVDRTAGFVEAWLRTHTLLVYAFLYIPIIIVVVYSFNGTNQRVMHWEGFSLRWYEYVAENNEVQRYLWNSVIVGLATATHLDGGRDDGGARAPARPAHDPPAVRCPDVRQRDRARARDRAGHARVLRLDDRSRRHPHRTRPGSRSGSATTRSSARCRSSTSASRCSSCGRGCRAWTGRTSRRATTCTGRRCGRSGRSRSRS